MYYGLNFVKYWTLIPLVQKIGVGNFEFINKVHSAVILLRFYKKNELNISRRKQMAERRKENTKQ